MTSKPKVLLGMSGGTDSSVSAMLLQDQGFEVIGITLYMFDDPVTGTAPSFLNDAANLAKQLNFKHYIVDVRARFRKNVIDYFVGEYLSGRTPFPCIVCNRTLKWAILEEEADRLDCTYISTGHYARIKTVNGRPYIHKAVDEDKDQSFFLWTMTEAQLRRTIFPLGDYTKTNVRQIAAERGFHSVSRKKDSMGVCFIEGTDYRPFLKQELARRGISIPPGQFFDTRGAYLGSNEGYPFYTIGQRRGLGIYLNRALYAVSIDPSANTVRLGSFQDLLKNSMYVENFQLIDSDDLNCPEPLIVKIRYRKQATPCRVEPTDNNRLKVTFLEPLSAIAAGQGAAFYIGDRVIGGGIIGE